GQTVRIKFLVHQDGFGDDTSMFLDDVSLLTACPTGTPPSNTPTRTGTPPTATRTNTPSPTACIQNYTVISTTGTIITGTVRIDGVGCDDCTTGPFTLPFPFTFYGTSYTSATVGSNGMLSFATINNAYAGSCLPVATATYQMMLFYRDMRTDNVGGCN